MGMPVRQFRPVWIPTLLLLSPFAGCRTAPTTAALQAPADDVRVAARDERRGSDDPRRETDGGTDESSVSEIEQVDGVEPTNEAVAAAVAAEVTRLPAAVVDAAPGLTVFDAITTALAQNPDLITQRQTERVGRGAVGLAETYPFNPSVQIQATPYQDRRVGTPGTTNHYVLVMQQIQLAHQQRHRENIAYAQLNSIRWTILQAELNTIAQAERLYFTALYQAGLKDLAQATADNNQELLRILEKRLEAGDATGADVAIVRLDARSTQQQLVLAKANAATALLDLRRHLGLSPTVPIPLAGGLEGYPWRPLFGVAWGADGSGAGAGDGEGIDVPACPPNAAPLSVAQAAGRPDVLAARSDIDVARAGTDLADASRVPDLQLGPYYQRNDTGTTFWGFRAQMDIPIWNTGTPLLRLREAELQQRVMAWRQLERRAGLEAEAAIDRYNRAFRLLTTFGDDSAAGELPVELQKLEEQFVAGEVDILRVFQSRNSLIQNRRALLDSLNEISQSAAAVTAATGLPLESLLVSGSEQPREP